MLRRYDLCERAARMMWIEILKMNGAGSWRGLAKKISEGNPKLDVRILEVLAWAIRESDN